MLITKVILPHLLHNNYIDSLSNPKTFCRVCVETNSDYTAAASYCNLSHKQYQNENTQ